MPDQLMAIVQFIVNVDMLTTYWERILKGVWLTIQLVAISCSLGFLIAIPLARMRMSGNIVLSGIASAYVHVFRGTPLLCQLYLVYYGAGEIRPELSSIGLWFFFREAYFCCIFAFTLNTAAYQSEIMRGAISAVPKGQVEAAKALGLSGFAIFRKVIFPQALLVAIRPMGNELITLIKASALAAIVTLLDLMGQTRFVFARTFDFSVYLYCAMIYLAMTETIRRVLGAIERSASRHLHVSSAATVDVPKRRWLRTRGVTTQTP
jgi:polar amino acid transport system permease protein